MRFPGPRGLFRIDGRAVDPSSGQLPLNDPLLAGVGLYETLGVEDRTVLDLDAHLDRLALGAQRLSIAAPDLPAVRRELLECAARLAGAGPGWVKVVWTGGGSLISFADRVDLEREARPASVIVLPWTRNPRDPLAGLKALNSANRLGRIEVARRGADEGVWLNTRGHISEGTSSNVFALRAGSLRTAAENEGILAGIVRAIVLREASAAGIPVHVGKLRVDKLVGSSEAFLTSSVRGVRPLVRFEGRPIGRGHVGPITQRIAAAVAKARTRDTLEGSEDAARVSRVASAMGEDER